MKRVPADPAHLPGVCRSAAGAGLVGGQDGSGTMYVRVSVGLGTATVTPSFGLRELPGGPRVCAFDVGKPLDPSPLGSAPSTSYSLDTCATMPPITVGTTNADGPMGKPGQPVRGHETRYVDENGHGSLWLLDAVNDAPILIAGPVPRADLYDIANRLVLPR